MEGDLADLARRLQVLEDINAIQALKAQYWSSLDRQRLDDVRACFVPQGAIIDMDGVPRCEDREPFLAIIKEQGCRPGLYNMHQGHTPRIKLTAPDQAEGIWDGFFTGIDVGNRLVIQLSGEYHDIYVRQGGAWLIQSMQFRQSSFLMERIGDDGVPTVISLGTQNTSGLRPLTMPNTDAAVETLLTKQTITEILYRYCRAFDRMDYALAQTVWHADGTCNYTNRLDQPDISATDYFGPSWAHRATLRNHSHQVTNILIECAGGRAASEAYFTASLQTEPQDGKITEHLYRGRYLDRWSRRAGVWGIDHRQVVFDSYTPYAFSETKLDGIALELTRRDPSDPSYAHFERITRDRGNPDNRR